MKTLISLLFALLFLNSCNPINKNVERYDEAKHKELGEDVRVSIHYMRGDTGVWQSGLHKGKEGGGYYEESPPGPSYYMIYKYFYPNGVLGLKGMYAGEFTPIGMWYYYDDRGNLIEEVDEDAKFGKINFDWIIEFLKEEGFDDWRRNTELSFRLRLRFFEVGEYNDDYEEGAYNHYPFWLVRVFKGLMIYYYDIHGDTGEILRKGSKVDSSYIH